MTGRIKTSAALTILMAVSTAAYGQQTGSVVAPIEQNSDEQGFSSIFKDVKPLSPLIGSDPNAGSNPDQEEIPSSGATAPDDQPANTTETISGDNSPKESQQADDPQAEKAKIKAASVEDYLERYLTGSWARIGPRTLSGLTQRILFKAQQSCTLPANKIDQFQVAKGAETTLPSTSGTSGDLVYYRTDSGLQRMDSETSRIDLIGEIAKLEGGPTGTYFSLKIGETERRIVFDDDAQPNKAGSLMIEEESMYILCPHDSQEASNG